MAKVFTIVEGLENLGAMKTGGQGSVYKGRRQASIYTAVKMLPTPIYNESADDKNYRSFQNEVEKLYKVNEQASPYVVKILSSGLTESGSFPYIEMEYIEGPDLCELLQPPHPQIFPVREAIKVADQLASALAHCHRVGVFHGDIKSNNVRYNTRSGNYVLLDFGLALMSEEQRRTSLRHAGAIEFMAPEQNQGEILPQTDIYSYGVVLYELLAGRVPFVLEGHSETARNTVMLSHMEAPVPDVLECRKQHLPADWNEAQTKRETQVPDWLLNIIYKCLSKSPADRYPDGVALQEAVAQGSLTTATVPALVPVKDTIQIENTASTTDVPVLQSENERLQALVNHHQQQQVAQDAKLASLQTMLVRAGGTFNPTKGTFELKPSIIHLSRYTFMLLVVAMCAFVILFARLAERHARLSHAAAPVSYKVSYNTALHSALPGIKPFETETPLSAAKKLKPRASTVTHHYVAPLRRKAKKRHRFFGIFF
jgi:serine/threonine protein kinase